MPNMAFDLPAGYTRKLGANYEEYHIPPTTPKPFDINEKLVEINKLPSLFQPAFDGFKSLNRIQSKLYKSCVDLDENLLLCAPTGGGKTNVAILCMLREIAKYIDESGLINAEEFKLIYIAPMKSLVQELVGYIGKRLSSYNLTVKEVTGDTQLSHEEIITSHVIVCTPEKWDIITRKGGKNNLTRYVKLVIIDEIHLLHSDRGPVIEALVARTIRNIEATQTNVRIIGLSATLSNYEDVAAFLKVDFNTGLFFFDSSYRPVPLTQQYFGIRAEKIQKRRIIINDIVYEKVIEKAGKNQVLIFVHSRKDTGISAKILRDMCIKKKKIEQFLIGKPASRDILKVKTKAVNDGDLKNLLTDGFAIHHAGMSRDDRSLVEELFGAGHIQVLVSTATLAWGVNLPAQTVIIKGTEVYNPEKACWVETSPLDVLQMLGRAGRPQYDEKGEGILITQYKNLFNYLNSHIKLLPIESKFISKLPFMLNAEIVLETVNNLNDAVTWLSYTYLFVRMLKSPSNYGIGEITHDDSLIEFRTKLIKIAAVHLEEIGQIEYDKTTGSLKSTELGRIGSYYYCSYDTIATFNKHLKPTLCEIDLLRIFTMSEEFRNTNVREDEKVELQNLRYKVPVQIMESLGEASAKINILLQAYISRLEPNNYSLLSELDGIIQSAARLFKAIFEIALFRGWPKLAEKAMLLSKMVDRRMWQSKSPLWQFSEIPDNVVQVFEKTNISLERLFDLGPNEIEDIVKTSGLSRPIYRAIHLIPRLNLSCKVISVSKLSLKVLLDVTPEFEWDEEVHGNSEGFWLIVMDEDSEITLHYQFFLIKEKHFKTNLHISFLLPSKYSQCHLKVISEQWFGSDSQITLSLISEDRSDLEGFHSEECSKAQELLNHTTDIEDLLEIISEAIENKPNYDTVIAFLVLRTSLSEKSIISKKFDNEWCRNAYLLLHAHLWRIEVDPGLIDDKDSVIIQSINILQSCLSYLSLKDWLSPAIAVINLLQMITQAIGDRELTLLQLPQMTAELIEKIQKLEILHPNKDNVELLLYAGFKKSELLEFSKVLKMQPKIKITFDIENKKNITHGEPVSVIVSVTREHKSPSSVFAPFIPLKRKEGWWILIGDPSTNSLLYINEFIIPQKGIIKLTFVAPNPGYHLYKLYFMCDAYLGFDKEYEFNILVQ